MNFLGKETEIFNFIKDNLGNYLVNLPALSETDYIQDFVDFDKYKQKNCVFVNTENAQFEPLSSNSMNENLTMHVIFKCCGDTTENLRKRIRNYATAFWNFFYDDGSCTDIIPEATIIPCDQDFNGAIDFGIISYVDFYDAADGNPQIKVCDITLALSAEV